MPTLDALKALADQPIDPIPPTWPLVFYLLIKHQSAEDADLGAVVAVSREAALFSYARDSFVPMYFCTIGGHSRLVVATGYAVTSLRTTDAEESFAFIREAIDAGKGVFVAGPEIGLCYGYSNPGAIDEREVYGVSNWGPAFNGTYRWDQFVEHVAHWGKAEGFACVHREADPGSPTEILRMIASTAVDWQREHPAGQFGMKQAYYGLTAFERYLRDLRDPEVRAQIETPYLNCHALLFQADGRHWLGQYIASLAEPFTGDIGEQVAAIGQLYMDSSALFKRFQMYNILEDKSENEIQAAIGWLDEAYRIEFWLWDAWVSLQERL